MPKVRGLVSRSSLRAWKRASAKALVGNGGRLLRGPPCQGWATQPEETARTPGFGSRPAGSPLTMSTRRLGSLYWSRYSLLSWDLMANRSACAFRASEDTSYSAGSRVVGKEARRDGLYSGNDILAARRTDCACAAPRSAPLFWPSSWGSALAR